jgi:hypothetical protein
MTNKLTERLTGEGYTRKHFPDYVRLAGGYALKYEYTYAKLCSMVWETPCGLLKKGGQWLLGSCSSDGETYSAENNNPLGKCPYYDKIPCRYRLGWAAERKFWGCCCVYHEAAKPYDYNSSVDKLEDEADVIEREARERIIHENPHVKMCHCYRWNRREQRFEKRFDIDSCVHTPCHNEICAITLKPLDKEQIYIVYDLLKEWHTKSGFLEDTRREIIKGIKKFNNSCDRTIGELWIKANHGKVPCAKLNMDEQRLLHYQQQKAEHPEIEWELPDGYDVYEFSATAINLRVKKKGAAWRDLAQDLADIAEGITVTHDSDNQQAAAQQKRERKFKRQEQKRRRKRTRDAMQRTDAPQQMTLFEN